MTSPHDLVARAFARADGYDDNAPVQRRVARRLAARIAALNLPEQPRVLEIGCGTGFLTQALAEQGLRGVWQVTDLAPAMVTRCAARMADIVPSGTDLHFAVLDGEYDTPQGDPFDLICSSLAVQWFDDAPAALSRLATHLAPGGHMLVTTLGPDTFSTWRAAHKAEGLAAGTPLFASSTAFAPCSPVAITREAEHHDHADARQFLNAIKAIGAHRAAPGHHPLTPAALRRVMARFEAMGARAEYDVLTIHLHKPQELPHG